VLQHSNVKEGDGNNAVVAFFSLLQSCAAPRRRRRQLPLPSSPCYGAQLHKEGNGSCCRLLPAVELRCNAAEEGDSVVELRCNAAEKVTLLWSCVAMQRSEAGDSVVELRCNATEEGDSVVELRCNAAQRSKRQQ